MPTCDLHCDSFAAHHNGSRDLRVGSTTGHLDLPRMRAGGLAAEVFAIWVDPELKAPGGFFGYVESVLDSFERFALDAADAVWPARSPAELEAIAGSGRIAAVLGVEGGHALEGDVGRIDRLHARGVRVFTVTWNNSNALADGCLDSSQPHSGISAAGRAAVRRLNSLGMIVDVSHASERAFHGILDASAAPVIASHSGLAAFNRFPRNLTDGQVRALAQNRGMVGIIFLPYFLRPEGKGATVADVVAGIDHVCQLVGPDHVGLGSDFDGFEGALEGLEDCSKLGAITAGLRSLGHPDEGIDKVMGGNFIRVWREVAALAPAPDYCLPGPGQDGGCGSTACPKRAECGRPGPAPAVF